MKETVSVAQAAIASEAVLPAGPGWEEVADYALDWALRHARRSSAV